MPSMNVSSSNNVTPSNKAAAAVFTVAGMGAYYLPVTKDRFVRTAFDIVKDRADDTIEQLNDTALALTKGKLSAEDKVFLAQNGVSESVDAINTKIAELKKSVTDSDIVKNMKQGFSDNFKDFKKSEAMMDTVASKAFSKIRWSNFGWGAVIGFILGSAIGSGGKSS